jgi:acyl-CoA reductase-like NAD-dependent aldehyde dehydrogenase
MHEAGAGPGVLNVLVGGGRELGEPLVQDPRVRFVSFTGSVPVGERIRTIAGLKKLTLELGSNSPLLVFADADLEAAAAAAARGAFAYSGQVCISVQRILVDRAVKDAFLEILIPRVEALKIGDPLDEATDVGPMISPEDAQRIESWIAEAVASGARVLTGGTREGERFFRPTLIADVTRDMRVVCEEAFAPVATVETFEGAKEAIALANDSVFGLQAGVFTRDVDTAWAVARELQTGGVWVNDSPITRFDHYPYGGAKQSGLGREGVKYAIEEMTEPKFIGFNLNPPR